MLGVARPRVPRLMRDNKKVVKAKPQRPRGAGLANLRCLSTL